MSQTKHWTDNPAVSALIRSRDEAYAEITRLREWIDTAGRNCPSNTTIDAVLSASGFVPKEKPQ